MAVRHPIHGFSFRINKEAWNLLYIPRSESGSIMKTKKQVSSETGFTLAELMVVVCIMAVIGFIGVMNIAGRAPYYRMDRARWQVVGDLRAARQNAVAQSVPVIVKFESSSVKYTIWTDSNQNGDVDSGEQVTKSLSSIGSVSMSCSPESGTFTPLGTWKCSSSYTQIILSIPKGGTNGIIITPSGEVRNAS